MIRIRVAFFKGSVVKYNMCVIHLYLKVTRILNSRKRSSVKAPILLASFTHSFTIKTVIDSLSLPHSLTPYTSHYMSFDSSGF